MEAFLEEVRQDLGYSPYACGLCPGVSFPSPLRLHRHCSKAHFGENVSEKTETKAIHTLEAEVWRQMRRKFDHLLDESSDAADAKDEKPASSSSAAEDSIILIDAAEVTDREPTFDVRGFSIFAAQIGVQVRVIIVSKCSANGESEAQINEPPLRSG